MISEKYDISGLTNSFLVKFQESENFTGDSYLRFNQEFTLPGYACSLCMRYHYRVGPENVNILLVRFNLKTERGVLNWLLSYSVASNPDKMNMCEYLTLCSPCGDYPLRRYEPHLQGAEVLSEWVPRV